MGYGNDAVSCGRWGAVLCRAMPCCALLRWLGNTLMQGCLGLHAVHPPCTQTYSVSKCIGMSFLCHANALLAVDALCWHKCGDTTSFSLCVACVTCVCCRWGPAEQAALEGMQGGKGRWLITAQARRLSMAQLGVYDDHVAAAMETDEDFEGSFS